MGLNFTKQFNEAIEEFCLTKIPQDYVQRQINTMVFLRRRLIYHTPKPERSMGYATGHAAANWQVSKNKPNKRIRGSRENPANILTEQAVRVSVGSGGKRALGKKQKGFGNNGAYRDYFIFNNVPYVKFLETGNYDSAPEGIFRISVRETYLYFSSRVRNPLEAFT